MTGPKPRLYVLLWFWTAAVILAVGLVARGLGYADPLGGEDWSGLTLTYLACAYCIGQGVGEWRGLKYANYVRGQAER